jgi:hypothetical protein
MSVGGRKLGKASALPRGWQEGDRPRAPPAVTRRVFDRHLVVCSSAGRCRHPKRSATNTAMQGLVIVVLGGCSDR